MSTRSSIAYTDSIHIFEETNSGDICVELSSSKVNEKYDSPVISEDELIKLYLELRDHFLREFRDPEWPNRIDDARLERQARWDENAKKNSEWLQRLRSERMKIKGDE